MKISMISKVAILFLLATLSSNIALGNNWSAINSGTNQPLNAVAAYQDSSVFIAAGNDGTMLKSTDYGANWTTLTSGTGNNINDITLFGGDRGYFVADNGIIRKTTDKGANWTNLNASTNKRLLAVYALGNDTLIAAGIDGFLTISHDGGNTFQTQASNTAEQLQGIDSWGNNFYVVGTSGRLIRSTNRGGTWFTATSGTMQNLNGVGFFSNLIGVAIGDNGAIIRTVNGGSNWMTINSGTTSDITNLELIPNSQTAFATLANGSILKTTDSGANWSNLNTQNTTRLKAIAFSDILNGLAVGSAGTILATGNGQPASQVSLVSPSGGEYWVTGTAATISWTAVNTDTVQISYSPNLGTTWIDITEVPTSTSSIQWTVPSLSTDSAIVRVRSKALPSKQSVSPAFSIYPFRLVLTAPNGGESLVGGSFTNVMWNSTNISTIHIDYSPNNGTDWTRISSDVPANSGLKSIKLPLAGSQTALLRISDAAIPARKDISNSVFTIVGPSLTISAPTQGTSWSAGENRSITWASVNVNRARIELSTNGGTTWSIIAPAVKASNNSFIWTVPNTPSNTALLKLTDTLTPAVYDISDTFRINRFPIAVTAPNGGEILKGGRNYDIQWTSSFIQSLDIEYSSNNGRTWQSIASNVSASSGLFNWQVPKIITDSLKVRVINSIDPLNLDVSDNTASISGINILSPTNNQLIIKESNPMYLSINWESEGIDTVSVYLDGTAGRTVIANKISSNNTVAATFTNLTSQNVTIKVVNSADTTEFSSVAVRIGVPAASVLYPNGGEYFGQGRIERIKFQSDFTEGIDIKYFDGSNEYVIANDINPSSGYFDWTVPMSLTNTATIRIYHNNSGLMLDESDNVFTITDENVTLLTPNGGETFFPSERHLVSWNANNASFVDIDYITMNSGRNDTFNLAVRQPVVPSGLNWIVPNTPGENTTFIIRDSDKLGIYDTTNSSVKLAGIKLTSFEKTGEKALENSNYTINWIAVESGNIAIDYSLDNGATWKQIARDYPSTVGFYNWKVPKEPSTTAKLRIWQMDNSNVESISQTFEITGLALTSPNGGENWLIGTDHNITWTLSDNSRVKLEYSTDNGATWRIIVADVPGTPSSYLWDVPESPSKEVLVKVSSLSNNSISDVSNNTFTIVGNGVVIKSPNGGESWANSSVQQITWSSRNVDSVGIGYTSDAGRTWNLIDTVPAEPASYSWTLPTKSNLKYKVLMYDIKNSAIADTSDNFFTVTGAGFDVPVGWDLATQTGINSTIIIEHDVYPIVAGDTMSINDGIGFFYYRDGIAVCGGYGKYTGQNLAITVWGDNTLTTVKDGFVNREPIEVRIWDASAGKEYYGSATWNGNDYFAVNTVTDITALTTNRNLSIPIEATKWQLISSNVVPVSDSVSHVLAPINIHVSFAKNQEGQFYYPGIQIDDINIWQTKEAYMIYLWSARTLTVNGVPAIVGNYTYNFDPMKWYYLGYLPGTAKPISEALASISSLIMVKDTDGNIYYPAEGINNISVMTPGKGYQLISSQQISGFKYPYTDDLVSAGEMNDDFEEMEWHYQLAASATGSSSIMIARGDEFEHGDEIVAIYDGVICGQARFVGDKAALTIWGDNTETAHLDGALSQNALTFKVYSPFTEKSYGYNIVNSSNIISGENSDKVFFSSESIIHATGEKTLSSVQDNIQAALNIYPNPADDKITITTSKSYDKVVVMDLSGRELLTGSVKTINTETLNNGTYIIGLYSGNKLVGQSRFQVVR